VPGDELVKPAGQSAAQWLDFGRVGLVLRVDGQLAEILLGQVGISDVV
jgi:hypothetical protein